MSELSKNQLKKIARAESAAATAQLAALDLSEIVGDIWSRLEAAVISAKLPFHLPTISTIETLSANDNEKAQAFPQSRTVVLRRIETDDRLIMCHTDKRSPKIAQLQLNPATSWLFYDHPSRLQVRASGYTTIHQRPDDPLLIEQFRKSTLSSLRCYLAPYPPGEVVPEPDPNLPEEVRDRVPETWDEVEAGLANFVVLSTTITHLDWLLLHHAGHRRATFTWNEGTSQWDAQWVAV